MRFKPRSVSFTVDVMPTLAVICRFSNVLVNACDRERLSKISLSMGPRRQLSRNFQYPEVSLSTFQSFLTFPNVEHFEFDALCSASLDDEAIGKLAACWPKLTSLSLNQKSGWQTKSRVTHRGLIMLLSRCAALREFSLVVDFTDIDQPHSKIPSSRPGNGITSHCQNANFIESTIDFPITIAAFLSDICPRLRSVRSSWSDGTAAVDTGTDTDSESDIDDDLGWTEVRDMLPAFLAVRRQCQEWYTGERGRGE